MKTTDGIGTAALKLLVSVLAAGMIFTGCGSDDDDENDAGSNVVRMSSDTNPVARGGAAIVSVDFSFSSDDVFDDDQNVAVVVFVPSELTYRGGTAEIDRPIGDDRGVEPQIFPCANGSFLLFDLDEDDLIEADNPGGDADATVKFTLDAITASGAAVVQSAANNNGVPFTCDAGMVPQAVVSLVIL